MFRFLRRRAWPVADPRHLSDHLREDIGLGSGWWTPPKGRVRNPRVEGTTPDPARARHARAHGLA